MKQNWLVLSNQLKNTKCHKFNHPKLVGGLVKTLHNHEGFSRQRAGVRRCTGMDSPVRVDSSQTQEPLSRTRSQGTWGQCGNVAFVGKTWEKCQQKRLNYCCCLLLLLVVVVVVVGNLWTFVVGSHLFCWDFAILVHNCSVCLL